MTQNWQVDDDGPDVHQGEDDLPPLWVVFGSVGLFLAALALGFILVRHEQADLQPPAIEQAR